ncbi:MAG: pyocin knob domain-containing protein [Dethiobacteria bacterium]
MAEYTQNYNLKKPAEEDFYNVKDFNDNADIIDQALKAHDDALATKETPAGAQAKAEAAAGAVQAELNAHLADDELHMTQAEKTKLAGLPNDAVNAINAGTDAEDPNTTTLPYIVTNHANSPNDAWYWHIRTYFFNTKTGSRAQIAVSYHGSTTRMFIRHFYDTWTPWEELVGTSGHVGSGGSAHALATTSAAGFMSAEDKQKLNSLEILQYNEVSQDESRVSNTGVWEDWDISAYVPPNTIAEIVFTINRHETWAGVRTKGSDSTGFARMVFLGGTGIDVTVSATMLVKTDSNGVVQRYCSVEQGNFKVVGYLK